MPRPKPDLLTNVELEFMKSLWALGRGSVREVMAGLGDAASGAGRAYTSVATVLRILSDKGFVTAEAEGRALIYRPTLSREAYEARSLRAMSRSLFGGTPSALVARLVEDEAIDDAEIAAIRRIIDERFGDSDRGGDG